MIVGDSLYGDVEIEEVLEKLILSDEIQRLKDVHMAGMLFYSTLYGMRHVTNIRLVLCC
ncbi:hypothetical protein GQR36_23605 [Enterococcus termitis]